MAQLFRCETVNQFKIGSWLADQGVTEEDISAVALLGADTVNIYNMAGQYMTVHWRDGHAEIGTEE